MKLEHTRHQLPVGQGFFHLGSVTLGGPTFYYIYDCGSENGRALSRAINYVDDRLSGNSVDVLFLSHFHKDHVCGLDQLLVKCNVKCAILPYLTPHARLSVIAQSIDDGTIDASYLTLLADPTAWFSDRGVSRVIYVSPQEPPDNEPPNWTRNSPSDYPLTPSEKQRREGAEDDYQKLELQLSSIEGNAVDILRKRRAKNEEIFAHCLQPLRLHCTSSDVLPNWQFVTFVHPEGEREEAFRQEVRRRFGRSLLLDRYFDIDQRRLMQILQNKEERDKLASCYSVIRKDKNRTSLSVYSGPINMNGVQIAESYPPWPYDENRSAWLGTGDANLLTDRRRRAFTLHYHSLKKMIANLAIPHHGSRHNFHIELCQYGDIISVSSGVKNKYGHPHNDVKAIIGDYRLRITTEQTYTAFFERFVIEPTP